MNLEDKNLLELLDLYRNLAIDKQIDSDKFYLYSIVTHSTAIEGSTVTEIENQLLFDEGISAPGRTIIEQMMNLDLKAAYEYGYSFAKSHKDYSVESLKYLASKVMNRTGEEYTTAIGNFSTAKGDLRLVNVTAGFGGRSYMNYTKVPSKLNDFCKELNYRRKNIIPQNVMDIYKLSFWAHYELVTIHPWSDGNGRTSRLVMNMIQREFNVLPMKVLKEDKAKYIEALVESREKENIDVFIDTMLEMHIRNIRAEIREFIESQKESSKSRYSAGNKSAIKSKIGDKKQAIINYFNQNKCAKASEIASFIKLSPSRTRDYLAELVKEGYLRTEGANKNRIYIWCKF